MSEPPDEEHAGQSELGRSYYDNSDGWSSFPELGLYLVTDGDGPGGTQLHPLIAETLRRFFAPVLSSRELAHSYRRALADHEGQLVAALQAASAAVFSRSTTSKLWRGAGASAAAMQIAGPRLLLAHVGDCRIYRLRDGRLEALTEDHSLLREYLKTRSLTAQEIADFPHKNVITRVLGIKPDVEIETRSVVPAAGDLYVLCTDGVHKSMSDEQIADALRSSGTLPERVRRLIQRAQELGGPDNITALVVRW